MSFRTRLLVAFGGLVALLLVVLLLGVRAEVDQRLSAQFQERADALSAVIRQDITEQSRTLSDRLETLASDIGSDNRFRLALRRLQDRRYLLDYAGEAMRRSGLALLLIQDSSGRILSSGHFRNEYDRLASPIAPLLARAPDGVAVVRVRLADGELLSLAGADSVTIAGDRLTIVGGWDVRSTVLRRYTGDPGLQVTVHLPADSSARPAPDSMAVAELNLPFIDATAETPYSDSAARILVAQSRAPLTSLRRSVDRWFLGAGLLAMSLALVIAAWTAGRVSKPLRELAEKTARIDLDKLDVEFASGGDDEIGSLSGLLGEMTRRLRASMSTLRDAERRATVGDLARQLNHDVKNGLIPVRNVFRHLVQVAREDPAQLPAVLLERQGTIDAGIVYLENLAKNYARLSPALNRQPCDLNATIEEVVRGQPGVRLELSPGLPPVAADAVVMRRILENLLTNALDSLDGGKGTVRVVTGNGGRSESRMVRLVVADEGKGMTERELERAFEDFYTTKSGGTGLGLSIVRRLVLDLEGTLRVETARGTGTRFIIDLPRIQ